MYRKAEVRIGTPIRLTPGMASTDYFRFGGLSNRTTAAALSHVESPDLLNIDFSAGTIARRLGYQKVAEGFKDASLHLDGFNDYALIQHRAAYQPTGTNGCYIGIGFVMFAAPATTATLVSKGYVGTGQAYRLHYVSATGTWTMSIYDAAGVATNYSVVDLVSGSPATGVYRYAEWYQYGTGTAATFKLWDDTGVAITSATTTAMASFFVNTDPFTLGARLQSVDTFVVGDSSFLAAICEFRYAVTSAGQDATAHMITGTTRYKRELTPTEAALFTGYWKLNDGKKDGVLRDLSSALQHGSLPVSNSAVWNTSQTEVCGTAGLEFKRGVQFVRVLHDLNMGTTLATAMAGTAQKHYSIALMFTPRFVQGTTTIPDQCLIWAGVDPVQPQPFGIRIIADRIVATYRINATTYTATCPLVVSTYVNKRIRVLLVFENAGTPTLYIAAYPDINGTVGPLSIIFTVMAAGAVTTSTVWSIGRHCTSASPASNGQYTFATDGATLGVIDSVSMVMVVGSTAGQGVSTSALLNGSAGAVGMEIFTENFPSAGSHVRILHIPFDEGAGSVCLVGTPANTVTTALIIPEEKDSGRWNQGLVAPYIPPECTAIVPYTEVTAAGALIRSLLMISGCTLYKVNPATGAVVPVAGDFFKGTGTWSFSKYGDKVFFATDNSMRPMVYDSHGCRPLGIEAPTSPPTVNLYNGAGTFLAGAYGVYYTYRNSATAEESNPSPITVATFAGANDTIDSIYVPVSPSRFVTQRRIWITLLNGAVAYLAATIDDNVTTNYTTDILSAPLASGVALEMLTNQEAPQASIVGVFKDFLFCAGEAAHPNRVYRNSRAGAFYAWDKDVHYVELELDKGDPVTNLLPTQDTLQADVRDGRYGIYLTGSTAAPFKAELLYKGHASIGRSAATQFETDITYMGESDVYITDGSNLLNLSSPPHPLLPSIQATIRTGLNTERRQSVVACNYAPKSQTWLSVSTAGSGRNNQILVYDRTNRNWSKYDIPADFLCTADNAGDLPQLYAAIFGKLYTLETGLWDGTATPITAIVASATSSTITMSTAAFVANALVGLRIWVYRVATADTVAYTVYENTTTTVTVYETVSGVAAGDVVGAGLIPMYIDFNFDFGDPLITKRLRWLKLAGSSSHAGNMLRVTYKPVVKETLFNNQSGATNLFKNWTDASMYELAQIGGMGRSFRFRFAEAGIADLIPVSPLPSIFGTISISDIVVECEALDIL